LGDHPVRAAGEYTLELGLVVSIPEAGNTLLDWDGATGNPGSNFYTLKGTSFNAMRALAFRYAIFGHQTNPQAATNDCTSGWAEGTCPSPKLRSADIVTSRMLNGRHAGERGWASRHATGHGGRVATCLETRRGHANGGQITRSKHNVVIAEAMVRLDGRAKRSYALAGCIDDAGHRLRGLARPSLAPAARPVSRPAHPW
jgi:hypothetical protein